MDTVANDPQLWLLGFLIAVLVLAIIADVVRVSWLATRAQLNSLDEPGQQGEQP